MRMKGKAQCVSKCPPGAYSGLRLSRRVKLGWRSEHAVEHLCHFAPLDGIVGAELVVVAGDDPLPHQGLNIGERPRGHIAGIGEGELGPDVPLSLIHI